MDTITKNKRENNEENNNDWYKYFHDRSNRIE